MEFNFLDNLAWYILEAQSSSALPNIAMQGLEESYESPSLILLAGFIPDENPFVVNEYFKKVLQELNVNFRDKKQAFFFLVKSIVKKILNNQVDAYVGCDFIFNQVLSLTDFRKQDDKFAYDSIKLADIYSLYVTSEEITYASMRWDKSKTNEQVISEVKEDIKTRFREWNNNNIEHYRV